MNANGVPKSLISARRFFDKIISRKVRNYVYAEYYNRLYHEIEERRFNCS